MLVTYVRPSLAIETSSPDLWEFIPGFSEMHKHTDGLHTICKMLHWSKRGGYLIQRMVEGQQDGSENVKYQ